MNGKADGQQGNVTEASPIGNLEILDQARAQLKKTVTFPDESEDIIQALRGHRDGVTPIMTAKGEILEIIIATITRTKCPRASELETHQMS